VIPSLREWHEEYGDQGLVVIGNHYPEFNHEADLENLMAAVDVRRDGGSHSGLAERDVSIENHLLIVA
jgi:hypothetical protein